MAKTRANTRRPKSAIDRERYTAELSTGQLVIGVVILLVFGLGCFLLGIVIGKFDPSLRDQMATADTPGLSQSPRVPPTVDNTPAPEVRPQESTALPPEMRVPQAVAEQQQRPPDTSPAEKTTPTPDAAESGESVAASVEAAAEQNRIPPGNTQPVAVQPPPAEPQAPAAAKTPAAETPKPAVTPPVSTASGRYGVQIIAVARPRAEGAKRDIEAKSGYPAQVIPISDSLYKVVVGRFDDKSTADRVRDEMRSKYQFRDAYVIALP